MEIVFKNTRTLAMTMIENLDYSMKNTINGDRYSDYFCLAIEDYNEQIRKDVNVSLIENKFDLSPEEWYFTVHVVDDVNNVDCSLIDSEDLTVDGVEKILLEVVNELKGNEL